MVYGVENEAADTAGFAMGIAYGLTRQKLGQRVAAKGYYDLGLNKRYLTVKVFATGRDLSGERVPVVWRAAFHHVGDINLATT